MRTAYHRQKSAAKVRGIAFEFEYNEWVVWWEKHLGPNWFLLRGCKKGQYVMARYYDDGPYVTHNVKCILAEENHIERNKRLWIKRRATGWHFSDEALLKMSSAPFRWSR